MIKEVCAMACHRIPKQEAMDFKAFGYYPYGQ